MNETYHSLDLGGLVLRLHERVRVRPERLGRQRGAVLEDATGGRYFRVGWAELRFLAHLDGRTTLADAVAAVAGELGPDAFTEQDAAGVCRWLIENDLAATGQSGRAERVAEDRQARASRGRLSKANPLMFRVPLGSPDRLARRLAPMARLLLSPLGAVLWLGLLAAGLACLWSDPRSLAGDAGRLITPDRWWTLAASVAGLKLLHEAAHAAVCRAYGGGVRGAGVMLLLLIPLPYVDVTDSWRFRRRRHRVLTAAAGMLAELAAASVAMIVWHRTPAGPLHEAAAGLAVTAGLTTLLFNANPLMRFDGYYMLSDTLGIPNLMTRAKGELTGLLGRVLFGMRPAPSPWSRGQRMILAVYGVAAAMWRVLITASLLVGASQLLDGAGVAIAAASAVLWFAMPWGRGLWQVVRDRTYRRVRPVWAGVSLSLLLLAGYGGVLAADRAAVVALPVLVDTRDATEVRADVEGFVDRVQVRAGNRVLPGQPLLTLRNDELRVTQEQLRLDRRRAELRARRFHQRGELAAFQAELDQHRAVTRRLEEVTRRVDGLTVRATHEGVVTAADGGALADLQSMYARPGQVLCRVDGESGRQLVVMARPRSVDSLRRAAGTTVLCRVNDAVLRVRVPTVEPTATRTLRHAALGADAGGGVAVRAGAGGRAETAEPMFEVKVPLAAETAVRLAPGLTGELVISDRRPLLERVTVWAGELVGWRTQ